MSVKPLKGQEKILEEANLDEVNYVEDVDMSQINGF